MKAHGFWSGGERALRRSLEDERAHRLAPLEDALRRTHDPRGIERLRAELARVEAELAAREKEIGRLLF